MAEPVAGRRAAEPRVTVVIATRNRRQSLVRTLRQLAALPEEPAIVVVDNDSDDGTVEAVRAGFPDCEVIPLARNRGVAARKAGRGPSCSRRSPRLRADRGVIRWNAERSWTPYGPCPRRCG